MAATLRASNHAGEVVDDPSESRLRTLLEGLGDDNLYLILERLEPGRTDHFMQVLAGDEDQPWRLEVREGPQATHRATTLDSLRDVHAVFTSWALDLPGWQDGLAWTPVEY